MTNHSHDNHAIQKRRRSAETLILLKELEGAHRHTYEALDQIPARVPPGQEGEASRQVRCPMPQIKFTGTARNQKGHEPAYPHANSTMACKERERWEHGPQTWPREHSPSGRPTLVLRAPLVLVGLVLVSALPQPHIVLNVFQEPPHIQCVTVFFQVLDEQGGRKHAGSLRVRLRGERCHSRQGRCQNAESPWGGICLL